MDLVTFVSYESLSDDPQLFILSTILGYAEANYITVQENLSCSDHISGDDSKLLCFCGERSLAVDSDKILLTITQSEVEHVGRMCVDLCLALRTHVEKRFKNDSLREFILTNIANYVNYLEEEYIECSDLTRSERSFQFIHRTIPHYSDLKDETLRNTVKSVSDFLWERIDHTDASPAEKQHIHSMYSLVNDKQLDTFGIALSVVACCQIMGISDVHLSLSEDHAWVSFGSEISDTAEVTWHGRGGDDRRGEPVDSGSTADYFTNWVYLAGREIRCNRHMELAAIVTAIVPSAVPVGLPSLQCALMQKRLLWVLHGHGHLDSYPMSLYTLADLEALLPNDSGSTPSGPTAEQLYHRAMYVGRTLYDDYHVYPYAYLAEFYLKHRADVTAWLWGWAQAADVMRKYSYSRDDETVYKEFFRVATEAMPLVVKAQLAAGGGGGAMLTDPECFRQIIRFYDGVCQWEEGAPTPVLHCGWATALVGVLARFTPDARRRCHLAPRPDDDDRSSSHSNDTIGSVKSQPAEPSRPRPRFTDIHALPVHHATGVAQRNASLSPRGSGISPLVRPPTTATTAAAVTDDDEDLKPVDVVETELASSVSTASDAETVGVGVVGVVVGVVEDESKLVPLYVDQNTQASLVSEENTTDPHSNPASDYVPGFADPGAAVPGSASTPGELCHPRRSSRKKVEPLRYTVDISDDAAHSHALKVSVADAKSNAAAASPKHKISPDSGVGADDEDVVDDGEESAAMLRRLLDAMSDRLLSVEKLLECAIDDPALFLSRAETDARLGTAEPTMNSSACHAMTSDDYERYLVEIPQSLANTDATTLPLSIESVKMNAVARIIVGGGGGGAGGGSSTPARLNVAAIELQLTAQSQTEPRKGREKRRARPSSGGGSGGNAADGRASSSIAAKVLRRNQMAAVAACGGGTV